MVYGLVDHRNKPSQRLLIDQGFGIESKAPVSDPGLEMWVLEIEAVDPF